jgi:hypothetical protein
MRGRHIRSIAAATAASVSMLLNLCCTGARIERPVASAIDDREAYAVYAAVLANSWPVKVARAKILVIQKETVTNWEYMPTGNVFKFAWRPVVDSFKAEDRSVRDVLLGYNLGLPYLVVSSADIKGLFEGRGTGGWTAYYRSYPDSGGYVLLSAVGFDPEKQRAIVYVALQCGALCGEGSHHFMQKANGVWQEVTIPGVLQRRWVS